MENGKKGEFESLGSIFIQKKGQVVKKPPAYPWQDLALKIIADLSVPGFKRNSVFKICHDYPQDFVERCVNDTKELCKTGAMWKYFFKVVSEEGKRSNPSASLGTGK